MTDDITALRQAQYLVFPSGPVMRVLDALEASQAECARLRAALEDIADPITAWQRDLPEGYTLDGAAAVSIFNNAETGRRMARAALATKETK